MSAASGGEQRARITGRGIGSARNGRTNPAEGKSVTRTPEAYVAGQPFQAWCTAWAAECLRVLRPGGHLLAFGGTRTYHRLACGIEDAGFEVRDSLHWLYGSGFPKSKNLDGEHEGWGTALKPSHEPVILARKPLPGTVAANVAQFGTGALNITGCRVEATGRPLRVSNRTDGNEVYGDGLHGSLAAGVTDAGRWPPNVLLAHSAGCDDYTCGEDCPVAGLDRQSGTLTSGANPARRGSDKFRDAYGEFPGQRECTPARGADSGGASRFFPVFRYEPKATDAERPRLEDGTAHPTVKPVSLMRWLVRLVTPPGGLVLDPFAGSGTTGEACVIEGFPCLLIERDPKFAELARTRLSRPIQPDLFGGAA